MMRPVPTSNDRVAHGVVFVLVFACVLLIPFLRKWPWVWLAPFVSYFLVVACVARLRRSVSWLRIGKISGASILATIVVMGLTVLALVLFRAATPPDVPSYSAALPFELLGGVILAGVIFTVVNATLEELVFRGILFDALQSQWGMWVTLMATSLLFSVGHLRGYPSGAVGACMAAVFGFAMGGLRLWTGGLALPIVAHMGADATIYTILVRSGVE
jgi:membrane protease YdiL (CAAX protease family)